jgi:hypothetical protein
MAIASMTPNSGGITIEPKSTTLTRLNSDANKNHIGQNTNANGGVTAKHAVSAHATARHTARHDSWSFVPSFSVGIFLFLS